LNVWPAKTVDYMPAFLGIQPLDDCAREGIGQRLPIYDKVQYHL
jgi:hypothetical protein